VDVGRQEPGSKRARGAQVGEHIRPSETTTGEMIRGPSDDRLEVGSANPEARCILISLAWLCL
jgi:hypothetical protein